jgi:hypothetical protein
MVYGEIVWTDYADNPIPVPMPNGSRAYMPCVIWNPDIGKYQMWYEQGSIALETYAESTDGLNWTNVQLCTGVDFETINVARPYVLYNTSWTYPYRAYWFGRDSGELGDHVRFAESKDGIAWENNQPLDLEVELAGMTISSPDGHTVFYNPVSSVAPFFLFLKTTDPGAGDVTSVFTSTDGLNWRWFDFATLNAGYHITTILQISANDFRAWGFYQYNIPGIQYFRSTDGIEFDLIEDPVANVGGAGPAGAWNQHRNYHPAVVYDGNGYFKMWRSGRNDDTGHYRTGFADGFDEELGTEVSAWMIY